MRQIHSFLITAVTAASLCGCGLISINESGYRRLSAEDKARVKLCVTPIDSLTYDNNIYQVDVARMRDYLSRRDDVIIYDYASFCHSSYCINPRAAEQLCTRNGYGFCLIISTYDYLERIPKMDVPVLAIDQRPYKTDKTPKYCDGFYNALTGVTDKVRGYGRFLHFNRGKFVKAYDDLNDAFIATDTVCAAAMTE